MRSSDLETFLYGQGLSFPCHRLLYKCSSWRLLYCLLVTILLSKNKICNRLFSPVNCFKWHLFNCSCTVCPQIPALPETWCIQFKYVMSFWKPSHLHGNPLTTHSDPRSKHGIFCCRMSQFIQLPGFSCTSNNSPSSSIPEQTS